MPIDIILPLRPPRRPFGQSDRVGFSSLCRAGRPGRPNRSPCDVDGRHACHGAQRHDLGVRWFARRATRHPGAGLCRGVLGGDRPQWLALPSPVKSRGVVPRWWCRCSGELMLRSHRNVALRGSVVRGEWLDRSAVGPHDPHVVSCWWRGGPRERPTSRKRRRLRNRHGCSSCPGAAAAGGSPVGSVSRRRSSSAIDARSGSRARSPVQTSSMTGRSSCA